LDSTFQAYSGERGVTLNDKVTLYLMDLPIKDDLSIHLAKLTVIIDKIAEISKFQNKKVKKVFFYFKQKLKKF